MTRRKPKEKTRNRWVTDTFTSKDIGQMLLSLFAIVGVFASKTILPEAVPFGGILLTLFTIIVLYIATVLFITKISYKKSLEPAWKHIKFGIIVSFVLTFFVGIIFGHPLYNIFDLYNVWFKTEAIIAFNFGLFWSTVLDSLKD